MPLSDPGARGRARRSRPAAAALLGIAPAALVGTAVAPLPAAASAKEYSAARKLGRALSGLGAGFLEVPGCIAQRYQKQGPAVGFSVGLAEGIGRFALRELVGTFELATSW